VKRSFSFSSQAGASIVAAGAGLVAATYGLVRLAYGLLLPDVQADLALSVASAGAISGGASVVYCGGALAGFFLAARHARTLVVAAALSAAGGAVGMATATGAAGFAVFAVGSSAGAGLASPALVEILRRNASTRGRTRAQTVVNAGSGPGLMAAGVLALVLLPDWRLAWLIAAGFTVSVAAVVLLVDGGGPEAEPSGRSLPPASWFVGHRAVLLAALLMGFGSAAVWTYGRAFLVESGAHQALSVLAWVALGAGGTAAIATAGRMDRLGPRAAWVATAGTVAASSAALTVASRSAGLALVLCAAFGWAYTAGTGALIAWTLQIDPDRAAAGTALLFVTFVLGQALGAGLLGVVAAGAGFSAAFLVAAAVSAAAAFPAAAIFRAERSTLAG
jgi:predicted MFS family arabinose efflux permease